MQRTWIGVSLLAALGCGGSSMTSVHVEVVLAAGEAEPAKGIVVSLFDRFRAELLDRPVSFTRPRDLNLPGDLVLYANAYDNTPVRIVIDGMTDAIHPSGAGQLVIEANAQRDLTITLSSHRSLDRDQDGIPDEFDNCPDVPNHDQRSKSGAEGDACAGLGDLGGAADLSTAPDLPSVLGAPDLLGPEGDRVAEDLWTPADLASADLVVSLPPDGKPPASGWMDQHALWSGPNDCHGVGPAWICGGTNGVGTAGYLYFCDSTAEVWTKHCAASCFGDGSCPRAHHGCTSACN